MYKIVFFDFDNTLYSHFTEQIPASTIKAIAELQKKGILCVLATGRCNLEMTKFNTDGVNFDYKIMNAGQTIYDKENKLIKSYPLTGMAYKEVVRIFNEKKIPVVIEEDGDMYLSFSNAKIDEIFTGAKSFPPHIKEYSGKDIFMATAFVANDEERDYVYSIKDCVITKWQGGSLDIFSKDSGKERGIKYLIDMLKIKQEETMAFGDYDNDVTMLKFVKTGIAMGNASEAALEASDDVTDHIDEDGIYKALVKYDLL